MSNHTIQLIILKTGEYIVAKCGWSDGETLEMHSPKMLIVTETTPEKNSNELKTNVALVSWPQFTKETLIEIRLDSTVTTVHPADDLKALYESTLK
jgi:ribosomal protein L30E